MRDIDFETETEHKAPVTDSAQGVVRLDDKQAGRVAPEQVFVNSRHDIVCSVAGPHLHSTVPDWSSHYGGELGNLSPGISLVDTHQEDCLLSQHIVLQGRLFDVFSVVDTCIPPPTTTELAPLPRISTLPSV